MNSDRESSAWSPVGTDAEEQRKLRVRTLNDELRQTMVGGQGLITRGIEALGLMAVSSILGSVGQYDDFSPDNDPYEEHDFGALTWLEHRIFWKIDYYDENLEFASPDPADPEVTARVITIMLASEY